MKHLYKFFFLVPLFVFLILLNGCGSSAREEKSFSARFGPVELQEDFRQMVKLLRDNHPALYDFTNKSSLDSFINVQYNTINDSLSLYSFFKILAPIVTKIGCGHTNVQFDQAVWNVPMVKVLPLKLLFSGNRAFVVKDFAGGLEPGAEIISINGQTIPSLVSTLGTYISTDGNNTSSKRQILNRRFPDYLGIQQDFPIKYEIVYKLPGDNTERAVVIDAGSRKDLMAFNEEKATLSFRMDPEEHLAVIGVRTFEYYNNLNKFRTFIDSCFHLVRTAGINHLILDLRGNSGGDPFCSSYLFSYLARSPVPYFKEPYGQYTDLAIPIPLAGDRFAGKLYILTDGLCFSSTGHLCALLRYHHLGTFIGTETGGTYTCNDNAIPATLKNTGLMVRSARSTFSVAVEGIPKFRGILPDYEVDDSTQFLFLKNRDDVMDFAMLMIMKANRR